MSREENITTTETAEPSIGAAAQARAGETWAAFKERAGYASDIGAERDAWTFDAASRTFKGGVA